MSPMQGTPVGSEEAVKQTVQVWQRGHGADGLMRCVVGIVVHGLVILNICCGNLMTRLFWFELLCG